MAYGGFIMDAAAELGRNPVSKHQIQPEYMEMSRLTRDGTAEPVSRDQTLRYARGQGNVHFPCSADHEQDWQPYPGTLLYVMTIHTYIHTYIHRTRKKYLRFLGFLKHPAALPHNMGKRCWRFLSAEYFLFFCEDDIFAPPRLLLPS